jgi:hypothetical protein
MHGSRSKTPNKNLVRQRCAERINSGVNGLNCFGKLGTMIQGLEVEKQIQDIMQTRTQSQESFLWKNVGY